ncbi:uncharacterized protein EAF01_000392 [Botrytis porri]|uniref:uncharacterized protein n=1 Tax=Botrytis porri TaxID=87229 RepID=UPI0019010770|nr:uncharacterized protein EAF01_000392 [Botrytis porri]KAF7913986.1 hypothetical protein EAF01_000392 [Botrytis porri]
MFMVVPYCPYQPTTRLPHFQVLYSELLYYLIYRSLYIIRQLPSLSGTLFQEYFEKIERLIVNDGNYASMKRGIEMIASAAKIYKVIGKHDLLDYYF